jgi:protein-tyrosine-phosphatase
MSPTRVLLVCAGNICRSPLAEAIARRAARERGLELEFESAGVSAFDGGRPTPEALRVAHEHGLDLSPFRSRALTAEAVRSADLVLTMTGAQRDRARSLGARRALLLTELGSGSGREVADPYGFGISAYRRVYAELESELELVLDALVREEAVA